MRILVACEYSGRTRDAFRLLGHDAWSCDLLACENNQKFHYQCDVREVLNDKWDLMIAHPDCTFLCSSGMHWTTRGLRDQKLTDDALEFVQLLMDAPIPRIAIENPVGRIGTAIRKHDQIIQPYEYGDDASKRTCLWLKGLSLSYVQQNECQGDSFSTTVRPSSGGRTRLTAVRTSSPHQRIAGKTVVAPTRGGRTLWRCSGEVL